MRESIIKLDGLTLYSLIHTFKLCVENRLLFNLLVLGIEDIKDAYFGISEKTSFFLFPHFFYHNLY